MVQRVPVGKTCAFCVAVAALGPVSVSTAMRLGQLHGSCDCQWVPLFGQKPTSKPEPGSFWDRYKWLLGLIALGTKASESTGSVEPRDIAEWFREHQADMVTDGHVPKEPEPLPPASGLLTGAEGRPDYKQVPSILKPGSPGWPPVPRLVGVTLERWQHILDRHAPGTLTSGTKFNDSTNIAEAILETLLLGEPAEDEFAGTSNERSRIYKHEVNGQMIYVFLHLNDDGNFWIASAHPRGQD